MGFNYGSEKRKFEADFARKRMEYMEAGMSESVINEIYDFDLKQFRKYRVFVTHNQLFSGEQGEEMGNDKSSLMLQFTEMKSDEINLQDASRHGWVNEIDSTSLFQKLKKLSCDDIELITLRMEGFTQSEIASILKISQRGVSKRLERIKKVLKSF